MKSCSEHPVISVQDYSLTRGSFRLDSINLQVYPGEIFALLGKTGSGKTLLLESIAGYYPGDSGQILLRGAPVCSIPLTKRRIAFVYQDYGLFPFLNVAENIGYGLRMRRLPKEERRQTVLEMASLMGISSILNQYPTVLSGGEKQRTALARALILNPDLLILDEPFAAMDPMTKHTLYSLLQRIHHRFSCAILFVTHDFHEAHLLADRIGIMTYGRLQEIRTPDTLFAPGPDEEMNRFLGIPGTRISAAEIPFAGVPTQETPVFSH